jgi:DNA-binding NtrC family response regulator
VEHARSGPLDARPLVGQRILVVDDERIMRAIVAAALVRRGAVVDEASDGTEALRLFSRYGHPVVLLDLRMPGLDGIEVLAQLRRESPATKVIIVTGFGDKASALRALHLRAFAFIEKPFNLEELVECVERAWLEHAGMTSHPRHVSWHNLRALCGAVGIGGDAVSEASSLYDE